MDKKTPLNQTHRDMGARMVPFGGWDMPVNYGSQIEEHHAVRNDAGMFDVSHMTAVDVQGSDAEAFLRRLLANDVARLPDGKALYSCMLNDNGGVVDDLITYRVNANWYRIVVNAGTTEKDLDWMSRQADSLDVGIQARRDLCIVAVQGPQAREKALPLLPPDLKDAAGELKPFTCAHDADWFVGRTGYTGEDGFEVMLPEAQVVGFWQALAAAGVQPCGLGARDTLRLEAGMNLYGHDMDDDTSPLEAGLAWTVAFEPADRDFIGRSALEQQKQAGGLRQFVGLVLEGRGVLRDELPLFVGERQVGQITSGGFSPTLNRSIGLARIEAGVESDCEVEIRNRRLPLRIVRPPFVRNGQPRIELD